MPRATLSRVTCPLDVSQFSHLGNFVVRNKICSKRHATTETFLISVTRWTCCRFVTLTFSHPGTHPEYARHVSLFSHSFMHIEEGDSGCIIATRITLILNPNFQVLQIQGNAQTNLSQITEIGKIYNFRKTNEIRTMQSCILYRK